jgi:hypothetical protein
MARVRRYIQPLPEPQARAYWEYIRQNGLLLEYQGHPIQYGHPFVLERSQAEEIAKAAGVAEAIVREEIGRRGGVSAWLADYPTTFGDVLLNTPKINTQLESRLEKGYRLPLAYDGIFVSDHGQPAFRVVEVQSAIGYEPWIEELLKAAGHNSTDQEAWYDISLNAFKRMKRELAGGEDITVMDTDPFGPTQVDQIGIARAMGEADSLPISPLDIHYTPSVGYYYYRYETNPQTGRPVQETETGQYRKTEERVPIKHVLSRMLQSNLDSLDTLLKDNPAQRKLVLQFLTDPSIDWIWHPSWQYIIDKATLTLLKDAFEQRNSPLRKHFLPIYGEGERVPPGTYVRKPTNAEGGAEQAIMMVRAGEEVIAEEDTVYQELFRPYPMRVCLPITLAEKFHPERRLHLLKRLHLEPTIVWATVEVRFCAPPYCRDELQGRFLARVAPRHEGRGNLTYAKTNVGKIQAALYNCIDPKEHELYPFGFAPVIVQ